MARGKILNTTKIEDIISVHKYFDRENQKLRTKRKTAHQVMVATANALNLSRSAVYHVVNGQRDVLPSYRWYY